MRETLYSILSNQLKSSLLDTLRAFDLSTNKQAKKIQKIYYE